MISILLFALVSAPVQVPSQRALATAEHVAERHGDAAIQLMGELVQFETFAHGDGSGVEHPEFVEMTAHLKAVARTLGFDFADHGAVVVVGLGNSADRLGLITHGDVQPADASKWARSPFELDMESEPGRLVGRGTEDDKGPIACALYAMHGIKQRGLPLTRRIELIISYTEESDWEPFREFLDQHPAPDLNVAFDASYPVVVAEKGWCSITVSVPLETDGPRADARPRLESFTGGFFLSQVPEGAEAIISGCTPALEQALRADAERASQLRWSFERDSRGLIVRSLGKSAHSSEPEHGVNGITHMAALLGKHAWPPSAAAHMLRLIQDRVGTGFYGERFGDLAYEDPFMGKLTLSFGTLNVQDGRLVGAINLRRPAGRDREQVEGSIQDALDSWQAETGVELEVETYMSDPHITRDAAHIPVLVDTFRAYTGREEAEPISIGGGTHARLVPGGVNFGPAMPGVAYTGHSEHEYMTRAQFMLNLK
ncbi:MAG: dipeptidase D, partial [Planctomycetota bacterium]